MSQGSYQTITNTGSPDIDPNQNVTKDQSQYPGPPTGQQGHPGQLPHIGPGHGPPPGQQPYIGPGQGPPPGYHQPPPPGSGPHHPQEPTHHAMYYHHQPYYPPNPQPSSQPMMMQPGGGMTSQQGPLSNTSNVSNVTNVVNVGGAQPAGAVIIQKASPRKTKHLLHCIITFFFFPWIIVWITLCLYNTCKKPPPDQVIATSGVTIVK